MNIENNQNENKKSTMVLNPTYIPESKKKVLYKPNKVNKQGFPVMNKPKSNLGQY